MRSAAMLGISSYRKKPPRFMRIAITNVSTGKASGAGVIKIIRVRSLLIEFSDGLADTLACAPHSGQFKLGSSPRRLLLQWGQQALGLSFSRRTERTSRHM